ncbi:hypothetical protein K503DRAFT_859296 [Rhizopogon vinicolor AM-OR11-026]|uniref:Uncharacterized protein n=1 Tax=Rhizopogon vinicolor AM-OR11-026 TaxID=1314800 RepID=A0A1B7MNX8_9AGAM|nr:hypothetical protein K503DRAFT_859296 [Rhizopogon vinicolor AM-OR11-026]
MTTALVPGDEALSYSMTGAFAVETSLFVRVVDMATQMSSYQRLGTPVTCHYYCSGSIYVLHPELIHYLVPYHLTRTMRFSCFVAIAALAASMSVSAQCPGAICYEDDQCCEDFGCFLFVCIRYKDQTGSD